MHSLWFVVVKVLLCIALSNANFMIQGPQLLDYYDVHPLVLDCPCSSPDLCLPLERARLIGSPHAHVYEAKKDKAEVFAFVLDCNRTVWETFDWQKLTTIALVFYDDIDITCFAHQNGVKVVRMANLPVTSLPNATARQEFVEGKVGEMLQYSNDGVNLDFEGPIADGSPEQQGYTDLVRELTDAIHAALPGGEMSVDVAWKSTGIDNRYYDYAAVGLYADLLFVMVYDVQSQIWDEPCSARANSALQKAKEGIESYTSLNIPSSKLVLGLPWYGYAYDCIQFFPNNDTCVIKKVEFQGAPCSDAVGRQIPYSDIQKVMISGNITPEWEESTSTPYYNFKDSSVTEDRLQMRYDDPRSLQSKISYAMDEALLAGVGTWAANFLDTSDTPAAAQQRAEMWGAMP